MIASNRFGSRSVCVLFASRARAKTPSGAGGLRASQFRAAGSQARQPGAAGSRLSHQGRTQPRSAGIGLLVASVVLGLGAATAAEPANPVSFDGGTGYCVAGDQVVHRPEAVSAAAWVRQDASERSQVFVNRGRANNVFTLYQFQDKVRMLIGHAEPKYTHASAPKAALETWTHWAGTYDGKTIALYRDGRCVGTTQAAGRMTGEPGDLFLGSLNEHERFLRGAMADIRLWSRALSAEEIAAVHAGKEHPSLTEGLVGWWTGDRLDGKEWPSRGPIKLVAKQADPNDVLINKPADGYRGIWYFNQPSHDEYVYKYSGGLGTYCAKHIPHAFYCKTVDKTFFTYGGSTKANSRQLIHMVSYYDHKTGMVPRPTILLDKQTDDAHDNPVISVDDKGTIWIFSSSHGTSRPSYVSRSVKPYSIDRFELVWTGNYSYPQPWFVPGKGFLLVHTYYTKGRTNAMMTSPDGKRWSDRRLLSRMAHGHYQISRPFGDVKVGAAFNYHPQGKGLNWRTNLYYIQTRDFGKTWQTVTGEKLEPMLTDIQSPALAVDYESKGLNVYLKDINYDAEGRPIVLYVTSKGYESGPENMPRTWTTARWTGTAWEVRGGDIVSDNNYDTGSLYIEGEDAWRIIGPTQTGPQPFNPGGEVAMWFSKDQGRSWTIQRQMTQASDFNHTYVRRPVHAHPDFYGFWADGHGRKPSTSRLYFCNKRGDVFRLPFDMEGTTARPERVK